MADQKKDEKLDWFPLYVYEFITDISGWTNQEIGAYFRLLCYQWINGFLSDDPIRLAIHVHEGKDEFQKIWKTIGTKFQPYNGGIANMKLERIRKKQLDLVDKKSDAGSAGANARWGEPVVMPFDTDTFKNAWELWKKYKKESFRFSYKTKLSEQAALKKISDLSGLKEVDATKIILQSIENQWQGFFALRADYGKKFNNTVTAEGIIENIRSRY